MSGNLHMRTKFPLGGPIIDNSEKKMFPGAKVANREISPVTYNQLKKLHAL